MKSIILFIIQILVIIFFASCTRIYISPICIRVVDSNTKLPIKNIKVTYVLQTSKYVKLLFILPDLEARLDKKIIMHKVYYTNNEGKMIIDTNKEILFDNFDFLKELIYINLDINEDEYKKELIKYSSNLNYGSTDLIEELVDRIAYYEDEYRGIIYNPNNKYKGFYIFNPAYKIVPEDWGSMVGKNYNNFNIFDATFNSHGLEYDKNDNKFVREYFIELESYKRVH